MSRSYTTGPLPTSIGKASRLKMLAILSFSDEGEGLAEKLAVAFKSDLEADLLENLENIGQFGVSATHYDRPRLKAEGGLQSVVGHLFKECSHLIFIGAAGIAVRAIAPYLVDKFSDPAVLVVDDQGQFCISLLSGHIGGGNAFAERVAGLLGAIPVITTGTDRRQLGSLDLILQAAQVPLRPHRDDVLRVNAGLLKGQLTLLYWEDLYESPFADSLQKVTTHLNFSGFTVCKTYETFLAAFESQDEAQAIYLGTSKKRIDQLQCLYDLQGSQKAGHLVVAIPRLWVLGTGSRKSLDSAVYEAAFKDYLLLQDLVPEAIVQLASVDIKVDEGCMADLASAYGYTLKFFSVEALKTVHEAFERSEWVFSQLGVNAVAGPAALLASGGTYVRGLSKGAGCTFALGRKQT